MSFKEICERLFFVRRCVGCGEILEYKYFDRAFCPLCEMSFRSAMTESCALCLRSAVECRCMPEILSRSGAVTMRRLALYRKDRYADAENKLIYYLKRHCNKRVLGFVAKEMAKLVKEEQKILDIEDSELFTVNVPRKSATVSKYGHDQAALIAKALGSELGIPYYPIIKRRLGGKEQKKLTAKQRVKNIKSIFKIRKESSRCDYAGKCALLIDDVSTTGASFAAATELLIKSGVGKVICFSIATTPEKKIKTVDKIIS